MTPDHPCECVYCRNGCLCVGCLEARMRSPECHSELRAALYELVDIILAHIHAPQHQEAEYCPECDQADQADDLQAAYEKALAMSLPPTPDEKKH